MKKLLAILTMSMFAVSGAFAASHMKAADDKKADAKKAKPAPNSVLAPITDEPGLPRVLLIGDSISMGYTLPVRKLLDGTANVHRIPQNGGATEVGLEKMSSWLGDGKWDVLFLGSTNELGIRPSIGQTFTLTGQYEVKP